MSKAASSTAPSSKLARCNAVLVRVLEVLAILAMGALVLDVVWGVVTRYMLGEQAKWTEELARFLLIWVSMLGGALAFRRRDHLGVDFLVGLMHESVGPGMHRLKHSLVCFATIAVFLYGGVRLVVTALATGQTTPALGLKMGYVYAVVPLAGVFILFFAIEELFQPAPSTPETSASELGASEPSRTDHQPLQGEAS